MASSSSSSSCSSEPLGALKKKCAAGIGGAQCSSSASSVSSAAPSSSSSGDSGVRSSRARSSSEDGAYSSTSEAELDSDHELDLDAEVDPQKLLGAWLGELDAINLQQQQQGLDGGGSAPSRSSHGGHSMAPDSVLASTPRLDGYRFSMVNLEESQDVELDAILGELCALESQFEREINQKGHSRAYTGGSATARTTSPVLLSLVPTPSATASSVGSTASSAVVVGQGSAPHAVLAAQSPFSSGTSSQRSSGHSRSSSSSGGRTTKLDLGPFQDGSVTTNGAPRTDSPDNDSAFSDNVSMLSSESSASSGGGNNNAARTAAPANGSISHGGQAPKAGGNNGGVALASSPTQAEQAARLKAEKIKIALEKMKEASVQKVAVQ